MNIYLGFDNGVTGTLGIITPEKADFLQMPIKKEQNYTKAKDNISRIDVPKLMSIIDPLDNGVSMFALLERPMVNPKRWKASVSAIRALESTITFLEAYGIGFSYCDSKEWQRELLPKGVKTTPELKKASRDIGIRMFPQFKDLIEKVGDADGILIAEYARRKY